MRYGYVFVGCAALVLAACGGEDAGSGNVPPPTGGNTGSPTTPSPPTATYETAFAAVEDRTYDVFAAQLVTIERREPGDSRFVYSTSSTQDTATGPAFAFEYVAATQNATLAAFGMEQSWPGGDIIAQQNGGIRYRLGQKPSEVIDDIFTYSASADIPYVVLLNREVEVEFFDPEIGRRIAETYAVGGPETVSGELPLSGTRSYRVLVSTSSPTRDGAGGYVTRQQDIDVDFAAASVGGTIVLDQISSVNGNAALQLTVEIDGSFSRTTGAITGTIASQDGVFSGDIAGSFYGPAGTNLAFAFDLDSADRIDVAGYLAAAD